MGERRRVLLVNGLRTIGGEERTVVDLATGLMARDHDVTIACDGSGTLVPEVRNRGVQVVDIGLRGKESMGAVMGLRRLMRSARPTIVHFHGSYPGILGSLAMTGRSVRSVWTIQLHPVWNNPAATARAPRRWAYSAAFRYAVRTVDETTCVSRSLAREFARFVGEPKRTFPVVYNGVAVEDYRRSVAKRDSFRLRHGIAEDTIVAGLVGRLTPRKGIPTFISAIAQLTDLGVLGLVARAGESAELEAYARSIGVADRIRFLGVVDRIDEFVSAIDVGVLPSLGEGLPLCIMEMLAASVPVVLSDIPMHREFSCAGPACVLAGAEDPTAFAEGIRRQAAAARDPKVCDTARRTATEYFSADAMVAGYSARYDAVLGRADRVDRRRAAALSERYARE